jgi:4-hydroxybenzoyl-CoA thioesterase
LSGVHCHPIDVRFGDCDPAGVVYFPRFFDWFHQAMESWFDQALNLPYSEVLERYGFPAVHTEADFIKPSRMGERIQIQLRVGRIGASSFRLDYEVVGPDDEPRVRGNTVVAMIGVLPDQSDHFRPVRIPAELRDKIRSFISAGNGAR